MKILFLQFLSFSATGETIQDYERNTWRHWIDSDGDCLNTRHELLARESLIPPTYKTNDRCSVIAGKWFGPFLGKYDNFMRTKCNVSQCIYMKHIPLFFLSSNQAVSYLK